MAYRRWVPIAMAVWSGLAGACRDDGRDLEPAPGSVPRPAVTFGSVTVIDPVAPAPLSRQSGSVYLTVVNGGPQPDTVLGVSAEGASTATFHDQHTMDGMAMMTPVPSLALAPGDTVRLRPGGLHIMLEAMDRDFAPGDSLLVRLTLARAGALSLAVPVIAYGALDAWAERQAGAADDPATSRP